MCFGCYLAYNIVNVNPFHKLRTFDFLFIILFGTAVGYVIFILAYAMVVAIEPVDELEFDGRILDKFKNQKAENYIIKVKNSKTEKIDTIEIDERDFYDNKYLVVGGNVKYNMSVGKITGEENFYL